MLLIFQVFFEAGKFCCGSLSGIQGLIFWNLIKQGKNISFINFLLAVQFFVNTINSYILIHFFFDIGFVSIFSAETDEEPVSELCKLYITSWLVTYTMWGIPNMGIMFCRFIYVRYSHGLVADMGSLFHKVVLLGILIFTFHWLSVWPINILLNKDDYTGIIKGKICNQIPFPSLNSNSIFFHIKAKMISCAIVGLYALLLIYFNVSSKKHRKKYAIPKRRVNILSMDQQANYLYLLAICMFIDQLIINLSFQLFHEELGVKHTFVIWWVWHLAMFSLLNIIAPSAIYWVASKEYPEFLDSRGKDFPEREGPRKMKIEPERPTMLRDVITNKENKRTFRFSYLTRKLKKRRDATSTQSNVWMIASSVVKMPEIEIV